MVDFSHKVLRDILGAEIDFESILDEDLILRLVSDIFSVATMVDGQPNSQFKAQANGNPTDGGATSVLNMDTITEGVFERDDQYNTKWILVTSGAASGQAIDSRFPIIDCDEAGQTFIVGQNHIGENLNEAGMLNNDTFQVSGHVHDGVDGEKIRVADLDFQVNFFLEKYVKAGRTQTATRNHGNSPGTTSASHTMILAKPGVDYLVTGTFLLRCVGVSKTGGSNANVKVYLRANGSEKVFCFANGEDGDDNKDQDNTERAQSGGGFSVVLQHGQTLSLDVILAGSPGGTVANGTGTFTIEATQQLVV